MRFAALVLGLTLGACAAQGGGSEVLSPADSATSVLVGGPVTLRRTTASPGGNGQDAVVNMTLTTADGRVMHFQEANHTPNDVMAQSAGGPLAQVMGFFADEQPTLYNTSNGNGGAPFICGPDGPAMLGLYRAPSSGEISVVGLRSAFEFEPRADGTSEALPYSPDHVCARMKFRSGS
jgi:hypothetical protein